MRFLEVMNSLIDLDNFEFVAKMLLATVCGAVLGFERKLHTRHIGMKTNFLICTGSMLFADLGLELAQSVGGDASRVTGQIVTGVGFLGAGAIMRSDGANIVGLTSAAVVWVNAAIGAAIGLGFYPEAFYFTLIILVIMPILHKFEQKLPKPTFFPDPVDESSSEGAPPRRKIGKRVID
ncbi:MAG: MgtC/SapB family protein [Bdellovibrionales bacterium]|jgi:putative Mg2+ transporter-C (MgtC) family protein|nr:MgtC/SapB family protein [Bdellovibrionales bacterium]